jgi:hypothetical protein
MKTIILLIILICFITSCGTNIHKNSHQEIRTGGPCKYMKYPGVARIIKIEQAPMNERNSTNHPKRIKFVFTPDDPSAPEKYSFTEWSDSCQYLKINAGSNPSVNWIKKNDIKPGNIYKCTRCEEIKGTCTPVIFEFPDLDLFPESGSN